MKKYEKPVAEITVFVCENIVTASVPAPEIYFDDEGGVTVGDGINEVTGF